MSDELTYDKNHPHCFFRETCAKWVKYNGNWYTPAEWDQYAFKYNIEPEVEWYHDIEDVLHQPKLHYWPTHAGAIKKVF
jgi:hypothetical protein